MEDIAGAGIDIVEDKSTTGDGFVNNSTYRDGTVNSNLTSEDAFVENNDNKERNDGLANFGAISSLGSEYSFTTFNFGQDFEENMSVDISTTTDYGENQLEMGENRNTLEDREIESILSPEECEDRRRSMIMHNNQQVFDAMLQSLRQSNFIDEPTRGGSDNVRKVAKRKMEYAGRRLGERHPDEVILLKSLDVQGASSDEATEENTMHTSNETYNNVMSDLELTNQMLKNMAICGKVEDRGSVDILSLINMARNDYMLKEHIDSKSICFYGGDILVYGMIHFYATCSGHETKIHSRTMFGFRILTEIDLDLLKSSISYELINPRRKLFFDIYHNAVFVDDTRSVNEIGIMISAMTDPFEHIKAVVFRIRPINNYQRCIYLSRKDEDYTFINSVQTKNVNSFQFFFQHPMSVVGFINYLRCNYKTLFANNPSLRFILFKCSISKFLIQEVICWKTVARYLLKVDQALASIAFPKNEKQSFFRIKFNFEGTTGMDHFILQIKMRQHDLKEISILTTFEGTNVLPILATNLFEAMVVDLVGFVEYFKDEKKVKKCTKLKNLTIREDKCPSMDEKDVIAAFENLSTLPSLTEFTYVFSPSSTNDLQVESYRTHLFNNFPTRVESFKTLVGEGSFDFYTIPLNRHYPNLKKLEICYSKVSIFFQRNLDAFEMFENLQELYVSCLQNKHFSFPECLRVLGITCGTYWSPRRETIQRLQKKNIKYEMLCDEENVSQPTTPLLHCLDESAFTDTDTEDDFELVRDTHTTDKCMSLFVRNICHISQNEPTFPKTCNCKCLKPGFKHIFNKIGTKGQLVAVNLKSITDWDLYAKSC
uniref:RNA-directed RNA polymerase n=1 Tax=Rhabditophanes sp. KR3021 TaxID=114890 RepID=A0AC35U4M2_9BILA